MTKTERNATLLAAVEEAARLGGQLALSHFRHALEIEVKRDGSLVTQVDRAVETRLRAWISEHFPADGILGEEFPEHNGGAKRRWIIDPIDGTFSFAHGVPLWGTLIAVAEGENVIAGAVNCPGVGEIVCAALGEGAWSDGTRCKVSDVADLAKATVLTTDIRFAASTEKSEGWRALASKAGTVRGWSDCYGYLLVATGRADAMVDAKMAPWDAAALLPVIEEAGGVFTDWTGRRTAFGGDGIATNGALAASVRASLVQLSRVER
jgi:histidinol-phosphatase